jgi:3-deoxy-manno-octulosonate cytidylyltransferase (CMP-KDO synthetase)
MSSTRFPGKPLAEIHGTPMLGHVYFRCAMSDSLDEVYIATCDQAIKDYADSIGAPCIMTSNTHERCSDRTAEAMLKIEVQTGNKMDIVVMVQGDEPMVTPDMLDDALKPMSLDPTLNIVNLMSTLDNTAQFEDPNEVKVVVDLNGNALYFSREPIPSRKKGYDTVPMLKQVCVIPFRRDYLLEFNSLEPTPLEKIESVDMMRVLEHGGTVKMVMTEKKSYSVDTPGDLSYVVDVMKSDQLLQKYLADIKLV